jgi:hypothetical protein
MKYPEMREELFGYLKGLSSRSYQVDCWLNGKCLPGVEHDELDYSIHFLFDDTALSDNPESLIGIILKNKEEADLIALLCKQIDLIFNKYGTDLSDKEYIELSEWNDVISAAQSALTQLSR